MPLKIKNCAQTSKVSSKLSKVVRKSHNALVTTVTDDVTVADDLTVADDVTLACHRNRD